ncbi:MAG: DUF3592 domain-containing protein [Peptococcaceae bacterium]|nr:DUF3592 domain-containing protein [Peptococcaceae bacterium]
MNIDMGKLVSAIVLSVCSVVACYVAYVFIMEIWRQSLPDSMRYTFTFVLIVVFLFTTIVAIVEWKSFFSDKGRVPAVIKGIEVGNELLYPTVKLQVLIKNRKGEFYSAQIETTIANTHLSKFQPGSKIDVAYDPSDPTKVTILSPTR